MRQNFKSGLNGQLRTICINNLSQRDFHCYIRVSFESDRTRLQSVGRPRAAPVYCLVDEAVSKFEPLDRKTERLRPLQGHSNVRTIF
jgi:hypothetical protein